MEINKDTVYEQICANIRFTDEISFKLLGLVPLISGATIAAVLLKNETTWSPMIYILALFGALITLGLFHWELRNLKTCNFLLGCAEALDELKRDSKNPSPKFIGNWGRAGKAQAEKGIYSITVLSWIALPWVASYAAQSPLQKLSIELYIYLFCSLVVVVLLFFAVTTKTKHEQTATEAKTAKSEK